jgi:hypothetical protein
MVRYRVSTGIGSMDPSIWDAYSACLICEYSNVDGHKITETHRMSTSAVILILDANMD